MGAEPLQRRCLPSAGTSTSNQPQQAAMELETASQFAEDHSPAARARKARRRLRRLFVAARRKAKGRARLCRADEYEVLRCAYRALRAWRGDRVHEEIERELRAEAEVAVSRRSIGAERRFRRTHAPSRNQRYTSFQESAVYVVMANSIMLDRLVRMAGHAIHRECVPFVTAIRHINVNVCAE